MSKCHVYVDGVIKDTGSDEYVAVELAQDLVQAAHDAGTLYPVVVLVTEHSDGLKSIYGFVSHTGRFPVLTESTVTHDLTRESI